MHRIEQMEDSDGGLDNKIRTIDLYAEMLRFYESVLRDFEGAIGQPALTDLGGGVRALRFKTQDTAHALIMKLAVVLSGLNACLHLLSEGHVYEQGVLQRVIADACEDVMFLALPSFGGNSTPRHATFLEEFWAEEFGDASKTSETQRSRAMPPRDKIRAYVAGFGEDPSTGNKVAKSIFKAYSGYVHSAAPHVMEIYHPKRIGFSVTGMRGTPRMDEYGHDLWNYIYRAGLGFRAVAKVLGSAEHDKLINERLVQFQEKTGRDGGARATQADTSAEESTASAGDA